LLGNYSFIDCWSYHLRASSLASEVHDLLYVKEVCIPARGNIFLPVRLLVWADGRGTVAQADSAARAELQEASKQKLLQLKNIQKYHWVKHKEMLICCFDVFPIM
jgi:hypothetical protein